MTQRFGAEAGTDGILAVEQENHHILFHFSFRLCFEMVRLFRFELAHRREAGAGGLDAAFSNM